MPATSAEIPQLKVVTIVAVLAVAFVMASWSWRAAAGGLSVTLAAGRQALLLFAVLLAAVGWEILDPGGGGGRVMAIGPTANPFRTTGVPLHAEIPLGLAARLMPLLAWSIAQSCGARAWARRQGYVPRAWMGVSLVLSLAGLAVMLVPLPIRSNRASLAAWLLLLSGLLMRHVTPVLLVLAALPVARFAFASGRKGERYLPLVLISWMVLLPWTLLTRPSMNGLDLLLPAEIVVVVTFMMLARREGRTASAA